MTPVERRDRRTIYVRKGDEEIWEMAEKLAGDSLAGLIADLLRDFVTREEQRKLAALQGMDRVEVSYEDPDRGLTRKAFTGRWVLDDYPSQMGGFYDVALTIGGRFVLLFAHRRGHFTFFRVFENLEELGEDEVVCPKDVLEELKSTLDPKHVQELDI